MGLAHVFLLGAGRVGRIRTAETVHDLQERVERCLPRLYEEGQPSLWMLLPEQQTACKLIPQVPNHCFTIVVCAPDRPVAPGTSIRLSATRSPGRDTARLRHPFNLSPLQPHSSQGRTIVPNKPLLTEVVWSVHSRTA